MMMMMMSLLRWCEVTVIGGGATMKIRRMIWSLGGENDNDDDAAR